MILDAISSASGTSSASSDSVSIADDFDTFLQILTTQLQNQNPLEPLDTNEFTSQLVEFSQVEQQIKQNENLEAITQLAAAAAATNAVSFVGKRVSVETTLSDLTNGSAMWHYDADESTDTATFTIRNSDGEVVWNSERSLSEGDSEFRVGRARQQRRRAARWNLQPEHRGLRRGFLLHRGQHFG